MKTVYPVIFTKHDGGYVAHAPDFPLDTQGDTLSEAIEMVRDAIGLMGIDMEDDGKALPSPTDPKTITCDTNDFVSMVDIDFAEYRSTMSGYEQQGSVSLPGWIAGINISNWLQPIAKHELNMNQV